MKNKPSLSFDSSHYLADWKKANFGPHRHRNHPEPLLWYDVKCCFFKVPFRKMVRAYHIVFANYMNIMIKNGKMVDTFCYGWCVYNWLISSRFKGLNQIESLTSYVLLLLTLTWLGYIVYVWLPLEFWYFE